MSFKHIIAAALLTAAFAAPAFADSYYIVREHGSKECRIVREKPTVTTTVVVGNHAYTTEEEARGQVKTVCVEH